VRGFLVLVIMTVLAACGGLDRPQSVAVELDQTCPQPRPQICTLEYAPVCAFLDGKRRREFSNGCGACSDAAVVGYISGPCPGEGQ
jgi:hypothetical protein